MFMQYHKDIIDLTFMGVKTQISESGSPEERNDLLEEILPHDKKRLKLIAILENPTNGGLDLWADDVLRSDLWGVSTNDQDHFDRRPKSQAELMKEQLNAFKLPIEIIRKMQLINRDTLNKIVILISTIIREEPEKISQPSKLLFDKRLKNLLGLV